MAEVTWQRSKRGVAEVEETGAEVRALAGLTAVATASWMVAMEAAMAVVATVAAARAAARAETAV